MKADDTNTRKIFDRGENLEIPFFQRSYVWKREQWERFLDDMRIISKGGVYYFFGAIILKIKDERALERVVIDGQQRLTTLNIFLKALCLKRDENRKFQETFTTSKDNSVPILKHSHIDEKSFNRVMGLDQEDSSISSKEDKIFGAYSFFRDSIDRKDDLVQNEDAFENILSHIQFVRIDIAPDEDEQQIFDTINSLGVRLTTGELLKNYFFTRGDIGSYENQWKEVFEKDKATMAYWDTEITTGRAKRTFIDLFFDAYLQIKVQDSDSKVSAEDKQQFSRVGKLFESYKQYIAKYVGGEKAAIVAEIKEYAEIFKKNFHNEILDKALTSESGMDRMNAIIFGLNNSVLIPYVFYVLRNVADDSEKSQLFGLIESYVMRRMVVKATAKNYNQLFSERLVFNKVLSKEGFVKHLGDKEGVNYWPSDDQLKQGFLDEPIYTNIQARGILYMMESKIRNQGRHATQLRGFKEYTIEHLMPKKWDETKWPLSDTVTVDFRNKKIHTIGNLAIIPHRLNSAISNAKWLDKKEGVGKHKGQGLRHCASGIETLQPYLAKEKWDEDEIKDRAFGLFKEAVNIWRNE